MIKNYSKSQMIQVLFVLIVIATCLFTSCNKKGNSQNESKDRSSLTDKELLSLIERLGEVDNVDSKYPEHQQDVIVSSIAINGKRAAPYLVEKISDENPSQCAKWYLVGDVANILLCKIYDRYWPSYEFTKENNLEGSVFYGDKKKTDYPYLIRYNQFIRTDDQELNRMNRKKLQEAWRSVVKEE